MADKVNNIVDICVKRLKAGETIEDCLKDYPEYQSELETLLSTAARLYAFPRPSATDEFKRKSYDYVMEKIRSESSPVLTTPTQPPAIGIFRRLALNPFIVVALIMMITTLLWFTLTGEVPEQVDAAKFTVSILRGQVEIMQPDSTSWEIMDEEIECLVGTGIKTSDASHAVITFFDGSTVKLDPGTEIRVSESAFANGKSARIVMEQTSGKAWNHVLGDGEQLPYYAVKTPSITLVAQGTSFSVEMKANRETKLVVSEGTVKVIDAHNEEMTVSKDQEIHLENGLSMASLTSTTLSKNELVLTSDSASVSSIRDPSGASTGYLPSGISFNQIPNSKSTFSASEQVICIEEPLEGEYTITVRPLTNTDTRLEITLVLNGNTVFENTLLLPASGDEGWLVSFNVETMYGSVKSGDKITIEPLAGKTPESLVETPLAKKRAVPIHSTLETDNTETSTTPETKTTTPVENDSDNSTFSATPTEPAKTTTPSDSQIDANTALPTTPPVTIPVPSNTPKQNDTTQDSTRLTP